MQSFVTRLLIWHVCYLCHLQQSFWPSNLGPRGSGGCCRSVLWPFNYVCHILWTIPGRVWPGLFHWHCSFLHNRDILSCYDKMDTIWSAAWSESYLWLVDSKMAKRLFYCGNISHWCSHDHRRRWLFHWGICSDQPCMAAHHGRWQGCEMLGVTDYSWDMAGDVCSWKCCPVL